jgi:hypothetical protein
VEIKGDEAADGEDESAGEGVYLSFAIWNLDFIFLVVFRDVF